MQTAPAPVPEPEAAIFLHGPRPTVAEVQVVWRADLTPDQSLDDRKEILALCPPSASEAMPVDLRTFRAWLAGDEVIAEDSDVEGATAPSEEVEEKPPARGPILRWYGPDDPGTTFIDSPRTIKPGDMLVVPAIAPDWDMLGHIAPIIAGPQTQVPDLGDQAYQSSRDRAIVRLTPGVVTQWPAELASMAKELIESSDLAEDPAERDRRLEVCLTRLGQSAAAPGWLRRAAEALVREKSRKVEPHPAGGYVVRGRKRLGVVAACTDFYRRG